jgi:23S rRNA (guanosine2251-2'-O)-methyltransferase
MRYHRQGRHHSPTSRSPSQGDRQQIICGIHTVEEALRHGRRRLEAIWLTEGKDAKRFKEISDLAAERATPIVFAAASRLTDVSGTSSHQGVVAFVVPSSPLTLEQCVTHTLNQHPIPPLAILDGVKDPRNFGAIIRSAAVFGIGGIVIPTHRAVDITATVAKTAAGGLEHVPIVQVTNISQCIDYLKRQGFWIIGTSESAEVSCQAYVYPSPLVLVFGEEGEGISSLVRRRCDGLVKIPGGGGLRSLNVAVAAAVLFYEVVGGRHSGAGTGFQ